MTDYFTGKGFIGKRIWERLMNYDRGTWYVGHRDITKHEYEPCDRFYFLSTYGNMAHHDELGAIYKANVLDVHHVLTKVNPKLLIFFSSSSVSLPVQTPYSIAKLCAELMITDSDTPYVIVRPYSVTGVGEQKEHLIPRLIDSCLNGTRMDFVPDSVHDFIDVEDVVDAVMYLVSIDNKSCMTYEVGKGVPLKNSDVLEAVERVCGTKANIQIRKSLRSYDSPDWFCHTEIAGWKPKKTLIESIAEMVELERAK
jgi:nucleoside-diphosphate-sugar epimerase